MNIGLLTRNEKAWCSSRLREAFLRLGAYPKCFTFSQLVAKVATGPTVLLDGSDMRHQVNAILVRPIGRGSLDQIIFRLNLLQSLSRSGIPVFNNPSSIEKAADKYHTLVLLLERGVRVPRTVVTENVSKALSAFHDFGGDAIVKPVFGSRGIGAARISDEDIAERTFRTLHFNRHVLYVQEFVPHGFRDIRVLLVGGRVVAAMHRVSSYWKTNVSRGARPVPLKATAEMEEIAIRSAEIIGCEIAGVDLMESQEGLLVNEINSQPGWRGLQSTTSVDIAEEMASYVISKAKR